MQQELAGDNPSVEQQQPSEDQLGDNPSVVQQQRGDAELGQSWWKIMNIIIYSK